MPIAAMSLPVAVMILLMLVIILTLAVFLIATIVELFKINRGLSTVIGAVGEIVAKTAPINGVLDAINGNLVKGRDLLENLFIKKAGDDAGGLVESLFPGEGEKFLQRVGRGGRVVNTGVVYTRGVETLASLGRGAPIGAAHAKGPAVRDPQSATSAAAMLYPRPGGDPKARPKSPIVGTDSPSQYESATTPGLRPRNRDGSEQADPLPPPQSVGGDDAPPPPPQSGGGDDAPPEDAPDRLNVKGSRPWER